MSADPDRSPAGPTFGVRYEWGAERVCAAIAISLADEPSTRLATRVETALQAGLAYLAAEPELAHLLFVRPFDGDSEALACYESWQRRAAEALRAAAARDPAAQVHPPFFEPALVSDLCAQVARRLATDPGRLEALLPDLVELVHACYYGSGQTERLVDA